MPDVANLRGRVIAAHGRHYRVQIDDTCETRQCYPRGKRSDLATGDYVLIRPEGQHEGVILETLPRRNLFYRSDAQRSKLFAANIDQLLLVLAPEPEFSDDLVSRALVAANSADVPVHILLNKADLPSVHQARARLQPLADLGVPIIMLNALDAPQVKSRLMPLLKDRCSLLLGQSGMGKSTLLNALVPDADAPTRSHSQVLGTGRHTTTQTRLYRLPDGGELIDSPGFQAFGLQHLSPEDIEHGFPEFAEPAQHCRFVNCRHRKEPGCGVRAALEQGLITARRHALYIRILDEHAAAQRY